MNINTYINTTPHALRVKLQDDSILEIPPVGGEIEAVFRGITRGSEPLEMIEAGKSAARVCTPPSYDYDWTKFREWVREPDTEFETHVYLVSTISAQVIQEHPDKTRIPRVRYLVPYSGPNKADCFRNEKGQIEWIRMFYDYTPI